MTSGGQDTAIANRTHRFAQRISRARARTLPEYGAGCVTGVFVL